MKSRTHLILFIIVLLSASLACNAPAATPTVEMNIFTLAAGTVTAAVTPVTATSTPAVTVTPTVVPCNVVSFVADVTTPDDTPIALGAAFVKTWRLKNDGSCTWTSGYQLVFDSGDQMGGPASQQLTPGTVAPGGTLDVSVNLTAPAAAGTYKGNWKLREPGGAVFGLSTGSFWVQIQATSNAEWPTYKKGDTGEEVYAIQFLLNAHGATLTPDGIFGPLTQSAVEDFQTDKGLSEDAIVGPQTWDALIIQLSQGKHGPEVRALQRLLKYKFGYNINVDGDFGPDTKDAVKDFQTNHGLNSDGIVGPKTWKKLIK
jgi:hypothetical protein